MAGKGNSDKYNLQQQIRRQAANPVIKLGTAAINRAFGLPGAGRAIVSSPAFSMPLSARPSAASAPVPLSVRAELAANRRY